MKRELLKYEKDFLLRTFFLCCRGKSEGVECTHPYKRKMEKGRRVGERH